MARAPCPRPRGGQILTTATDPRATTTRSAPPVSVETATELHRAGRLEEAERVYRAALARRPKDAQGWTNYGALLRQTGRLAPAIAAHRRALRLDPGLVGARNNLANALADDAQYAEAVALREGLLAEAPRDPARLRDLLAGLRGLWRHEEVIERATAAEEAGWASGEVLLQRALSRLMIGDYGRGFADFEHRYEGSEVALPANAPWPRWQGEDLSRKRIAVLPEQGFGDAIVMSRFLPGLVARGAEVVVMVKPPLARLLSGLRGVHLTGGLRKTDRFDFYTPITSLPHLVGFGPEGEIPPPPPLAIPEDSRARARALAAPFRDMFRVGVVWTGSLTYKANNRRSTTPESFLGLAQIPGVQLFSLYKGDAHDDFLRSGMAGLIVDACGADRDFADSAAVIDEMDLLVTTDTAVVHVAGSMGKPVWNMLAHEGFWLYGAGETTPWYPSMRLWRQREAGDWAGLLGEIEAALAAHPGLAARRGEA